MNRLIFLLALTLAVFSFNSCNDETVEEISDLIYLETVPGGCNNMNLNGTKSASFEKDTVYFSLMNDTLGLFVGQNYICCAPFSTDVQISDDSIFVSVTDTCLEPYNSCYCKCNCYYTWNFLFADFMIQTYYLKIELKDPRQDEPEIIFDGWIDVEI